jgi:predicted small metal-binding protein
MEEHKHTVTCPACGGKIQTDDQEELIKQVQTHAKDSHGMDLPREKVLEMEQSQASQ